MFDRLRIDVCKANLALAELGLVVLTWGNVSEIDREAGVVAIKPSGLSYGEMTPDDMAVVNLDGDVIEGRLRPSSDTATHLVLYRSFPEIGGVMHTHSTAATAWAQAGRAIPPLGTTHADAFYGPVPCTPPLSREEIEGEYERNTGEIIVRTFAGLSPVHVPAVLVACHGPFAWGKNAAAAVENALILEEVAKIAAMTVSLARDVSPIDRYLRDRHYFRKHGEGATYGQK